MWQKLKNWLGGTSGSSDCRQASNPAASEDKNEDRVRAAYAALGLAEGADLNTVRRTWKARLKEVHRDHYADDPETKRHAQETTQHLNHAYQILNDALF